MRPDISALRRAEFEAAATPFEFTALQRKWAEEDRMALHVQSLEGEELARLRTELRDAQSRIANLERVLLSADRKRLADHILAAIGDAIGKACSDVRKEIPRVKGVFTAGSVYEPNDLVTRSGALWTCLVRTSTAPGTSDHWLMIAKSGSQS
jgi:hypothetical protein